MSDFIMQANVFTINLILTNQYNFQNIYDNYTVGSYPVTEMMAKHFPFLNL